MKKKSLIYVSIVIGIGIAIILGGKTIAMWIAMHGVASTGTPICTLTGEARINAAIAWFGGGSLASGGGGIPLGTFILSMIPLMGVVIIASALGYVIYQQITHTKDLSQTKA